MRGCCPDGVVVVDVPPGVVDGVGEVVVVQWGLCASELPFAHPGKVVVVPPLVVVVFPGIVEGETVDFVVQLSNGYEHPLVWARALPALLSASTGTTATETKAASRTAIARRRYKLTTALPSWRSRPGSFRR